VTYKRLRSTLQLLSAPPTAEQQQARPGLRLAGVAYGAQEPRFAAAAPAWKPVNTRLDDSQRRAVELALRAHDVALIHGPPGGAGAGGGSGTGGARPLRTGLAFPCGGGAMHLQGLL
jgi:hypothetical protein